MYVRPTESYEELPVASALVRWQREDTRHVISIWRLFLLKTKTKVSTKAASAKTFLFSWTGTGDSTETSSSSSDVKYHTATFHHNTDMFLSNHLCWSSAQFSLILHPDDRLDDNLLSHTEQVQEMRRTCDFYRNFQTISCYFFHTLWTLRPIQWYG